LDASINQAACGSGLAVEKVQNKQGIFPRLPQHCSHHQSNIATYNKKVCSETTVAAHCNAVQRASVVMHTKPTT